MGKLAEQVVERAYSLHSARGGPVLTVRVEFNLGSKFTKPRKEEVASKLADLVLAIHIQVGDLVKLENDYDDLERLPEELTRVRVQRSAFRSRALWTALRVVLVPRLEIGLLQDRIDEKNKRAKVYRQKSPEIWLVIVHDLNLSLAFNLSDNYFAVLVEHLWPLKFSLSALLIPPSQ